MHYSVMRRSRNNGLDFLSSSETTMTKRGMMLVQPNVLRLPAGSCLQPGVRDRLPPSALNHTGAVPTARAPPYSPSFHNITEDWGWFGHDG
jgi:hypothetical protein